jgi:hypothetical protein
MIAILGCPDAGARSHREAPDLLRWLEQGDTIMALQISSRNQARITDMIEHGKFADVDTIIDKALTLLEERERFLHLKRLLAVGAEQAARGELIPYTDELREEIKRSARERFAAGEVAGPDVRP